MSCAECRARDQEITKLEKQVTRLMEKAMQQTSNAPHFAYRTAIRAHIRSIHYLRKGLEAWETESGRWAKRVDDGFGAYPIPVDYAAPEREVPCGPGRIN